ncbi:unnamed protein product [Macrosiphum euphorbiae]|uniref:Helitron helicase-like domain-containing protein n=1 Tax=Macrosiphum euphorbiae TaxID=13131 RepID=A0AAV0WZH5_9HEMI|nr:unnamed protein product [Macrosiphum euphorbiae]
MIFFCHSDFRRFRQAHKYFEDKFINNPFGYPCSVCDRLWFQQDLKPAGNKYETILKTIVPDIPNKDIMLCNTCRASLTKDKIPVMATYNGFKYPAIPSCLPALNLVEERLISPRLPFMNIRRLRHVTGQYGIYGQVINVPVSVNNMVKSLPRNLDDDYCINVHIKRRLTHKSSYLSDVVQKRKIKTWLEYLVPSDLYRAYEIKINESFFNTMENSGGKCPDNISENIPIEESLTAQQQTLLWNDDQFLHLAPGQDQIPHSLLFDEHAEELSFPLIYLGEFRIFREGVNATAFTIATSELRRSDRRGTMAHHLLYMAMKIMRLRVRDSLTVAFKHIGNDTKITKDQILDENFPNGCVESNLAFLRSIPNSAWYWMHRKKDLFAMIRQLGKPTVFLTVSANEIGWKWLLRTIYKLKNNGVLLSDELIKDLHYLEKSKLINEDSVTCAIYFNKIVNILINILKEPKYSPLGKHHVTHYFKRIEFRHRGSPHAHILLWLANAPSNVVGENKADAIKLIDSIISISANEASSNIKLQTHKHTFTCYKNIVGNKKMCRFEAPFLPSRSTIILMPMQKEERGFSTYKMRYNKIGENLTTKYITWRSSDLSPC